MPAEYSVIFVLCFPSILRVFVVPTNDFERFLTICLQHYHLIMAHIVIFDIQRIVIHKCKEVQTIENKANISLNLLCLDSVPKEKSRMNFGGHGVSATASK